MKRSSFHLALVIWLSSFVTAGPILARGGGGFRGGGGGGGFRGGGGFGGGGGGGFGGGGGGFDRGAGGGFDRGGGGAGGFDRGGDGSLRGGGGSFSGGGLSGGGFHPSDGSFNRGGGDFGGGGLQGGGGGDRPFAVHQPNFNDNLGMGNRPQIQPGGGFQGGNFQYRPGGSGNIGGNLSGATNRLPENVRPGSGATTLPGLSRPGTGGAGLRPGEGGAGERFPGLQPGQGGAGVRPGEGGAGERWNAANMSPADRHQDLENRFNNMGNPGWNENHWNGPNGGEVNHVGFWGPNGYWGHTGVWGPNGGYWGHSGHAGAYGAWGHAGYYGPAGHWCRNWGWYNGYAPAWGNGRWNYLWNSYPAAMAFGATMWGLNAVAYTFGVGNYYNPYYTNAAVSDYCPVSYAQPIVGDPSYDQQAAQPADTTQQDGSTASATPPDPLTQKFDAARQAFYNENFADALKLTNEALKQAPQDAAINEFRSLCLFALGQYRDAAANIHSVLAAGPGWDWTTLISLYSHPETYTAQLRKLEDADKANLQSADVRFLLGYHYLTCGHEDAAVKMWKAVVQLQPKDLLAQHLVQIYSPADNTQAPASSTPPPPSVDQPAYPLEKLQGTWTAKDKDGQFTLSLGKDDQFKWEFARDGKPQSVTGVYAVHGTNLVMQPDSGGTMLAEIQLKDDRTLAFQPDWRRQ